MKILQEKASIDWNNYLTKQEIEKFLSKDDKVESAEEIIYNTKGDFFNKYFKDFKEQGWTKRELTQDLAQFFYNGHLITENKEDLISQINEITNKCIEAGLKNKLKEYTIPCMRDYQLKFNPTADNRFSPWLYLAKELKDNKDNISWELQEFADTFIKEASKCYEDNNKLEESMKSDMENISNKYKDYLLYPVETWRTKFYPDNRKSGYIRMFHAVIKNPKNKNLNTDVFEGDLDKLESEIQRIIDLYYKENKLEESILLYHGSPNKNITKLEMGKEKTTGDEFGTGIYLTKQYDEAEQYAGLDGRIYKVELDDSNLYNLNDKLPNSIKELVKTELVNNNDIKNQIVAHNRKQYKVIDKNEGQKFYNDKKQEWKEIDNTYYANIPKVNKVGEDLIVTYTDYNDIEGAINNLTGNDLQKILSGNIDPNVFVELIIKAGYDGIITHNNNWYIIYRNEDKVKIVENEQLNEGIHLYGLVKDEDGNYKTIEDSDYPDKKSFESDLRANGYTVRRINDNRDNYIMDHSDYLSINNIKSEIAKLKKDYNYYKENGLETLCISTKSKIDSLQNLLDEANKISLTESHKLEEYDFDDYNKRIEEYKNKQLQDFISKLRTNLPKCKVSEPIHSKYSGDRIKITHKNLIITIILMELLETDSGKPEYAISYDGHQQYIGVADDVIQFIKDYIEQDYRLTESHKLEEVSRNELLAKTKMQTKTRYDKADSYRGFTIVDVNTDTLLTRDTLEVTCKVGKYWDTVELEDVLYWIQYEAEKNKDNQVNVKTIATAILEAIDAMEIKVDCTCGDFVYRFAYAATQGKYKYGKPENRPAKITNPNNYGALCKHLVAMLSNKKWMQQVATPVMDWFEKRIDEVNRFLRTKPGTHLTLPNELARRNAKAGAYAKMFDKINNEEEKETQEDTNKQEIDKEEENNE